MHLEVLKESARKLLPYLSGFKNYYLAGGTAIALQIGHRISVDFDFFSDKKLSKDLFSKIKTKIPQNFSIKLSVNNSEELTFFVNDTKVTFLYYPFPLVHELIKMDNMTMLSLKELAATKAYTIGRRGEYKDYIDIYFLLKDKYVKLKDLIKTAQKKYQTDFNDRLFLEQLIYFDDIDTNKIILLKEKNLNSNNLKQSFSEEIKKLKL